MSLLPNPFESAAPPSRAADRAAVSSPPASSGDAAADQFPSVTPARAPTTAAAGANAAAAFLDDTSDIHEIFHHARKLIANENRFVLDETAFMEAVERRPLFLQRRA